jgi:transposase
VFTTGIVATTAGHLCALFFTGQKHAGENLEAVLAHRKADRPRPIQMCDGLSHNTAGEFETIVANCLCHGRRQFVDVVDSFPDEVRYVLETLRDVYRSDALAKEQALTPEQRLSLHQAESGPKMTALEKWFREQLDQHKVEPNSGLGEAIRYMQKHWEKLTLFLRVPGAPLDNNLCERALKKAILHRKNALFYKTPNGARVGDIFMSLIHSAELNGADPFDYLLQLQLHAEEVARTPGDWMPWNYSRTLRGPDRPDPAASTPSR